MSYFRIASIAVLLAATPSLPDGGPRVRYTDPSGPMSLSVSQDITVRVDHPVHAGRTFSYDLAVAADADGAVTVTINAAQGDYTAHEQKQRLPTRSLTGKSFSLAIGEEGLRLTPRTESAAVEIGLGPLTEPGFSIVDLLADTLPILPREGVGVGSTWSTERSIRSLAGWSWTTGTLRSEHRVTGVEQSDGNTIVRVETEAHAELGPVEGGKEGSGDLTRRLRWSFDATAGRLLALTLEEETDGTTGVPQGTIPIHQVNRIELRRS